MKIKNTIVHIVKSVFNSIYSFLHRRLELLAYILTSQVFVFVVGLVVIIAVLYIPDITSKIVDKINTTPPDMQILQRAQGLLKVKDYNGAIETLEKLIEDFQSSDYVDDAWFTIGLVHADSRNYDEIRTTLKDFLEKFPNSELKEDAQQRIAESFFDEALELFKEKKYNQAHQNFNREELKMYPDFLQAPAMYNAALCLIRLGKTDKALESFSEFTTQFPESELAAKALNMIARWNYMLKNYERSLSIYRELLERFPESDLVGGATVGVVLSLHKLNRYQEEQASIKEFNEQFSENEWIKILKSYSEGLKQASYSELDLTSWEKTEAHKLARSEFSLILNMHHKLLNTFESLDLKGEIWYQMAQSYLAEEKYALAGLTFDEILTEEFSMWEYLQEQTMYQAAYCLKQQGIYDEALGRYLEFTNRFPESKHITDVYFDIGDIYVEKKEKDYDLARYNYNSALKRATDSNRKSKIHFDFATTYYNQNDYKNAILEYNKWLSIEEYPESAFTVAAKHLIANSQYVQDNLSKTWEETVMAYQRVLDEHGNIEEPVSWNINGSPEVPNRLALCAYRISDIYYRLGTQHHKAGDTKLAIEYWKKALDRSEEIINKYPTDDVVQYALHNALLINVKHGQVEGKTKDTLVEELDQKGNEYMDKLKKGEANEILLAAARLKFANVKHEELKDYRGSVREYAKLWNDYPTPHPRLNLIKLQGKYYEGNCYEKSPNSDTSSVETYKEATTLFKAAFQPLIDTPTIDIPNRDYYLAEATKIFQDLVSRYPKAGEAAYWQYIAGEFYADKKQFKKAIAEYEKVIKVYPTSEYAKDARRRIEEIRQTLKEEDSADASSNLRSSEESEVKEILTAKDIAEIASGSTVFIEMKGILEYESGKRIEGSVGSGSGFFVDHGLIATNYHVIKIEPSYFPWKKKDDGKDEVISTHPLDKGSARLVGTDKEYAIVGYTVVDPDRDLAILKVRAFDVKLIPLGNSDEVYQGDSVYPVGSPLGFVNVVSDGQISSIQWVESIREFLSRRSKVIRDVQRYDTPDKLLMMTAPVSPGNSGGPVLNSKGEVIGVSVGRWPVGQNLNFAVPVNYLKALLKRTAPPKPLSDLEIVY